MGASWIHGPDGNPITEIAEEYGIQRVVTGDYTAYSAQGMQYSEADIEAIERLYGAFMARVASAQVDAPDFSSLGQLVERLLQDGDYTPNEVTQLRAFLMADIEEDYAADLGQLSAQYWDYDEGFEGDDVVFPEGYDQIPLALALELDIRLEHIVTAVEYDETGVVVRTEQGDFEAYYAIVTVPLGVLKRGAIVFDPPLPSAKQQAIERLHMGLLNKVYLRFPTAFWPQTVDGFGYLGPRWVEWVNMQAVVGQPILMVFVAGSAALAYEAKSDSDIIAEVMGVLQTIFGQDIPQPSDYRITRWSQDPYTFGSYSSQGVASTPDDVEALAEPVQDVLFFAGEATSQDYTATVHGAFLSGQAAAEWLLEVDSASEDDEGD
jgi:monoamine oxidase